MMTVRSVYIKGVSISNLKRIRWIIIFCFISFSWYLIYRTSDSSSCNLSLKSGWMKNHDDVCLRFFFTRRNLSINVYEKWLLNKRKTVRFRVQEVTLGHTYSEVFICIVPNTCTFIRNNSSIMHWTTRSFKITVIK